jgi:hypothetical protein
MTTQFDSVFAFQASRPTAGDPAEELTFDRLADNKRRGVQTDFLIDNNLLINIDDACNSIDSVSDEMLRESKLYGWVAFLRECERQGLDYGLTPGFGYTEMPKDLAKIRAGRLGENLRKLGLRWPHNDSPADYAELGLAEARFDTLDGNQQYVMAMPFASLMLMHAVKHLGQDFSPIGRFKRYLREHRRLISIVSSREIAIARYVFAEPADCPGPVNEVRATLNNNFGRPDKKAATPLAGMEKAALNGAFDITFLNAMNLVSTKGFEGRRVDPWLFSCDRKLSLLVDYCFTSDLGTGESGLFSIAASHEDISPYWKESAKVLKDYSAEGARRVMRQMLLPEQDRKRVSRERIEGLPRMVRAVLEFADEAVRETS